MVQLSSLSVVTYPSDMNRSNFVKLSSGQFEQIPRIPLPLEHTVNDECVVGSTCALREQSIGKGSARDTRFILTLVSLFGTIDRGVEI